MMHLETQADYEPLAAALRKAGHDATADDGGHANYGVRVTISGDWSGGVFIACTDNRWGYSLDDRDGYSAGGDSWPQLTADTSLETVLEQVEPLLDDLRHGRHLWEHGVR